jgi:DNA-binding transcriptional ArsR family regulator
MPVDAFAVLAEPTRRRILDVLRTAEASVNELVAAVAVSQPAVSKHLKVLREAGFVTVRTARQQRIYAIDTRELRRIDAWLEPYRQLWTRHLDALERHLDRVGAKEPPGSKDRPGAKERPGAGEPRRRRRDEAG